MRLDDARFTNFLSAEISKCPVRVFRWPWGVTWMFGWKTQEHLGRKASTFVQRRSSQLILESEPSPFKYSLFLRDTVIYRTEYISLILGPQYEANKAQAPPLFYVSVHMDKRLSNKIAVPQILLHYGPNDTYPVIGAVRFRATTTSDITVWHGPTAVGTEP